MITKRSIMIAFALLVMVSMVLAACGGGAATPAATEAAGGPMQSVGDGEGEVASLLLVISRTARPTRPMTG
jgi:hypothetical protein